VIREQKKSTKQMWCSRVRVQQDVHVYWARKMKEGGEAYKCDGFYITKILIIEFASPKCAIQLIC
jgi:hypothetical protein